MPSLVYDSTVVPSVGQETVVVHSVVDFVEKVYTLPPVCSDAALFT